ncbi:MAG TPA: hypothetical protein ENK18_23520 [Deltaproteobacteria bacterium]|nr:hypothetical protein [Deltaproteobacteria bacterium]
MSALVPYHPLLLLLLAGCAKRGVEPPVRRDPVEVQRERAAIEGPSQTLERARLVSVALAQGDVRLAEATLRQIVQKMQDFRAEGQLRAFVGAERSKEWKGDPYEKMMAFLYLGTLLLERGDYGNALAMSKSAILADTGTSRFQYRADFIPAFVLQALAYQGLGERSNAERSIEQAIDAMYLRVLTDHLSAHLSEVDPAGDLDHDAIEAARVLLLSGLPAGLMAHPREIDAAIDGALSRATDLRMVMLDSKRRGWPDELTALRRRDAGRALDALVPLTQAWRARVEADPTDPVAELASDASFLQGLVDAPPGLLLWLESGRAPRRVADGRYGEILRIQPRGGPDHTPIPPSARLDGQRLEVRYLDSVSYQATTRGSRRIDAFLKGKAVFKDSSGALGWALLASGDIANALEDSGDTGIVATVLYLAGAVTWVAGALTNPAADTRGWFELPDELWLARADPAPGQHTLVIDGITYQVDIPDIGSVIHLVPGAPPGGVQRFGTPCRTCEAPLARPTQQLTPGETP